MAWKKVTEVAHAEWDVHRQGVVEEIVDYDDSIKWRVEVWDGEREPFMKRFFNDAEAAKSFLKKMMGEE